MARQDGSFVDLADDRLVQGGFPYSTRAEGDRNQGWLSMLASNVKLVRSLHWFKAFSWFSSFPLPRSANPNNPNSKLFLHPELSTTTTYKMIQSWRQHPTHFGSRLSTPIWEEESRRQHQTLRMHDCASRLRNPLSIAAWLLVCCWMAQGKSNILKP